MLTGQRTRRRRLSAAGMFIVVMVGTLGLLLLLRSVHTVAQDGLPTPEGRLGGAVSIPTEAAIPDTKTPTPVVRLDIPDPDLCDAKPRTVADMLALIEAESAQPATPNALSSSGSSGAASPVASSPATAAATSATAVVVTDRPATAAVVGQIQRTVREVVACGNAGELLSVWAYFSDDFVRSSAAKQPALFNSTILTARAQAQEPRTDAMPRVTTVRLLDDDRVSATVTIPTASPFAVVANQTGTVTLVFVQVNNSWLIDEVRKSDGTGG